MLRLLTPRRLARRVALAACLAAVAAPAAAEASPITLQTTYAGPIAATNRTCTAEPRALVYGTLNYNVGSTLSYASDGIPGPGYYVPANGPSLLDLEPALLAGGRSDLCLGFTLPPDVESSMIRTLASPGDRLQDAPAWDDHAETHVAPDAPGDPAPDGDDVQRIRIDLPVGTGLGLDGQATCTAEQFGADRYDASTCPAGAQMGDALVRLGTWHGGQARHLPLPGARLYLLERGADDLARVGLTIRPLSTLTPIKVVFRLEVDTTGRLRLIADDVPRELYATTDVTGDGSLQAGATARPIYLESLGLRLWGARADHPTLAGDLVASPTDCTEPRPGAIAVKTYAGTTSDASPTTLALSGCGSLGYDPTATVTLDDPRPAAPTGATIALQLGSSGEGRLRARTRSAEITLPAGLHLGGQIASGGLRLCAAEAFASAASTPADCPTESVIGTATLASDLTTQPLTGTVILLPPAESDDLARLGLQVAPASAGPAAQTRLKLLGSLRTDDDGLSLRFDALPALPLRALTLTLRGGERSVLTAPATCGDSTAGARLIPTAGDPAEVTSTVSVNADCAAAPPSITTSLTPATSRAGARDGFELTLGRADRSPALRTFSAQLPTGAAIDLRRSARCERSAIEAGSCEPAATLGTVRLRIGTGSAPTVVSAPLQRLASDDAVLATALARVPIRLGDLDQGRIDVPVAIAFDPAARRFVIAGAATPSGAASGLELQSVSIQLGQGIALNPTSCRGLDLSASAELAGGATATATGTLLLGGCAEQPLAPAFRATLSGESTTGGHPRAALAITPREGDANLATLALGLPAGLAVDASRPACDAATFAAGSCPEATRIGSATAATSLADASVGGTLTLVRVPGQSLPAIGLTISGAFGFRALAPVTTTGGRQTATFSDLPDLPLTRLDLAFDGGPTGALRIASPICVAGAAWRIAATGHGGQSAQATSGVSCQSREVGPKIELGVQGKTGLKLKISGFGGLRLQSAKLTLAPRLRFVPAAARQGRNTAIAVIGPKTKPTFSSTSLTLTVGAGAAPQEVVARVRWPAMLVLPRGHRKTTFRLRLAFADGTVQLRDVLVTLPAKLRAPRPR